MSCSNFLKTDKEKFYAKRLNEVFDASWTEAKEKQMLKTMSRAEVLDYKKRHFRQIAINQAKKMIVAEKQFRGRKSQIIETITKNNNNRVNIGGYLSHNDIITPINTLLKKGNKAMSAVTARLNAKGVVNIKGKKMFATSILKDDNSDFLDTLVNGTRSNNEAIRTLKDQLDEEFRASLKSLSDATGVSTPSMEAFYLSNVMNYEGLAFKHKKKTMLGRVIGQAKHIDTDTRSALSRDLEPKIDQILSRTISDPTDRIYATNFILELYGLEDGFTKGDIGHSSIFGKARRIEGFMNTYGIDKSVMVDIAKLGNTDGNFAVSKITKKIGEAYRLGYSFGEKPTELLDDLVIDLKNERAGKLKFKNKSEKDNALQLIENVGTSLSGGSQIPDTTIARASDAFMNVVSGLKVPLIAVNAIVDPVVNSVGSSYATNKGTDKFSTVLKGLKNTLDNNIKEYAEKLDVDELMSITHDFNIGIANMLEASPMETGYERLDKGIIKNLSNLSYDKLSMLRGHEEFVRNLAMQNAKSTLENTFNKFEFSDIEKMPRVVQNILSNSGFDKNTYDILKKATQGTKYTDSKNLREQIKKSLKKNREGLLISKDNIDTNAIIRYNKNKIFDTLGYTFNSKNGIMPKKSLENLVDDAISFYKTKGSKKKGEDLEKLKTDIINNVVVKLDKSESIKILLPSDNALFAPDSPFDEFVSYSLREAYRDKTEVAQRAELNKILEKTRVNPTESNPYVKDFNDFIRGSKSKDLEGYIQSKADSSSFAYDNALSELQDFNSPSEMTEVQKATLFMNKEGNIDNASFIRNRMLTFFKKTGIASFYNQLERIKKSKGLADKWENSAMVELTNNALLSATVATACGFATNYLYAVAESKLVDDDKKLREMQKNWKTNKLQFAFNNFSEGMFMTMGLYEGAPSQIAGKLGKGTVSLLSGDLDDSTKNFKGALKSMGGNRATDLMFNSLSRAITE